MEFSELQGQVFGLFDRGQFPEIISLLEREAKNFPEQGRITSHWLLSIHGRLGHTSDVLYLFRESLNRGWWYTENSLRGDEMYSLQGNPVFEELIAQNAALYAEAVKAVEPRQIVHLPEATLCAPLIMTLHGNNGKANSGEAFWRPLVDQGYALSMLQSTQPGNRDNSFVWDDYPLSKRDVEQYFEKLTRYFTELSHPEAIDRNQVIFGGFSVGAQVAIRMALEGSLNAKGFISVSGWLGHDPDLKYIQELLQTSRAKKVRGVIIIGDQDLSSYKGSLKFAQLLSAAGVSHQLIVVREHSHAFPDNFTESLAKAVRFILDE